MKRTGYSVWVAAIALAGGVVACLSWDGWDNQFKRREGWRDHDGGGSTLLPPVRGSSGGRTLMLFGDGTFWTPGYVQPADGAPAKLKGLAGNTIAIHTWTADHNSWDLPNGGLDFYARIKAGGTAAGAACGDDPRQWQTRCPVQRMNLAADFPAGDPDTVADAVSATGGFIPRDTESDTANDHFAWPKSAVYVSNPKQATPFGTTNEPFLVMGYQMKTLSKRGGGIPSTSKIGFSIVTGIENGGPETWTYRGVTGNVPLDTITTNAAGDQADGWGVEWGNSLYYDALGDRIRIYGEIYHQNPRPAGWACLPDLHRCFTKDMVLAVALSSSDIVDPTRWWYAYRDDDSVACPPGATVCRPCAQTYPNDRSKWSSCYAPVQPLAKHLEAQLKHVADNIAGDFTVDHVCHDQPAVGGNPAVTGGAGCAWVLVHGGWYTPNRCRPALDNPACALSIDDPFNANPRWIVVRTTDDDIDWPSSNAGSYDAGKKQSTWITDAIADQAAWDRDVLCTDAATNRRSVRQILAHDEVSPPGTLAVSWYVASAPDELALWPKGEASHVEGTRVANLRFGALDLKNLRPWCAAAGSCPTAPVASCCGAAGQACCAAGPSCAAGLGCNAGGTCAAP